MGQPAHPDNVTRFYGGYGSPYPLLETVPDGEVAYLVDDQNNEHWFPAGTVLMYTGTATLVEYEPPARWGWNVAVAIVAVIVGMAALAMVS
jgi:hypothetical protein